MMVAQVAQMAMNSLQAIVNFQRKEADLAYQRSVAANQARYESYQARLKENEIRRTEYEKRQKLREIQRQYAQQGGKRLSLLGAGGGETDSGSALDVLLDSAARSAEDQFEVERQAGNRQRDLAYEAGLLRTRSKNTAENARDSRTLLEKGLEYYKLVNDVGGFGNNGGALGIASNMSSMFA